MISVCSVRLGCKKEKDLGATVPTYNASYLGSFVCRGLTVLGFHLPFCERESVFISSFLKGPLKDQMS